MTFRQFAFNNVFRNKRTYAAYFLSSAFSVMVFFVYAMFVFHPGVEQGVHKELVVAGMKLAEYVIYIFSFFFVLYSVSAFLKSRKKEFGVLMMHGMSQWQLNKLVFIENMVIGFVSIVCGIVIGLIFSKFILLAGAYILDMDKLSFYVPAEAVGLTFVAFLGLFLVISTLTTLFVRGNRLIELFQGSAKPKPEPKNSILLSLLSVGLIGTGYVLAATTTKDTIAFRMLPVTGMVIVGTYFLFTQFSIFALRLLKRNRHLYWHRTNLVIISDLVYRMKDNARIFFLVAIVSAVAFSAVGTLASTGAVERQTQDSNPFTLSYSYETGPSGDEAQKAKIAEIERKLQQLGVAYTKVQATVYEQTSVQSGNKVTIVKQDDFNRLAQALGWGNTTVEGHEAMFVPGFPEQRMYLEGEEHTVTLQESGITVHAAKVVDRSVFSSVSIGSNILLVSNEVFDALKQPGQKIVYTGFQADDWKATESLGQELVEANKYEDPLELFSSYAHEVKMFRQIYGVMLFIGVLVGAVFFVSAGSFLYFRLYTDLDYDKRQYRAIAKLGLSEKELRKIVTPQIAILFFLPFAVAFVHSVFAFIALQSLIYYSIAGRTLVVLGCFLLLQIAYFFLIRSRYLRHLKEVVR